MLTLMGLDNCYLKLRYSHPLGCGAKGFIATYQRQPFREREHCFIHTRVVPNFLVQFAPGINVFISDLHSGIDLMAQRLVLGSSNKSFHFFSAFNKWRCLNGT